MNHAELLNYLDFDPESGVFTRKVAAGNKKAGSVVGNIDAKGYLKALVLGEYVKLHRLAWFYVYSEWPSDQIDHINNVKTDNRIQNLRVCDTSTNCHNQHGPRINNNSGFQGIHKIAKTGRYRAACSQWSKATVGHICYSRGSGQKPTKSSNHNTYLSHHDQSRIH